MLKHATNISRERLISAGTKIGKFTHSGKFHLHITCLELLAQYARVRAAQPPAAPLARSRASPSPPPPPQYKVWVKPSAELAFLYGNHVTKSGLVRMTEETPQYAGVLVLNQQNTPIGFGLAAQSTELAKEIEPTGYVALHQADIGEYLRSETTIV